VYEEEFEDIKRVIRIVYRRTDNTVVKEKGQKDKQQLNIKWIHFLNQLIVEL
jgi:hypothetical protein